MIKDDKMSIDPWDKFANENELFMSQVLDSINQSKRWIKLYEYLFIIFIYKKERLTWNIGKRRKNISRHKILKVYQYN